MIIKSYIASNMFKYTVIKYNQKFLSKKHLKAIDRLIS